jgi:CheY-like chemotaxis protein
MPRPLLLLVDDAPEIIHIVKLLARRSDQQLFSYSSAASMIDALCALEAPRPDLLLLDIHLPAMTGIELYRLLRNRVASLANVPAALFSQGVPSQLQAEAIDAGIEFVVSKELLSRPEGWKERIDEVLELAGNAPVLTQPIGPFDPEQLTNAVQSVLSHPVLSRLGDEVVLALWRRAGARAKIDCVKLPPGVDVSLSHGNLAVYWTRLVANSEQVVRFLLCLSYQVECLLGRAASSPLRAALEVALQGAKGEQRRLNERNG